MLTLLDTVKARLGLAPEDVQDDTLLENLIKFASGRFEADCRRKFGRVEGATWEFRADAAAVFPERVPLEAVSAWHLKETEADGWEEQTEVDYLIGAKKNVLELDLPLGTAKELARVTYTGGYVLPGAVAGAGQTALPAVVEQACVEQVAYWYQRRNQLGLVSISGEGGSIQNFPALDLLPNVKAVLKSFERWEP